MAVAVVHLFYYVNTQGYLSASGMRKMRQAVIITHPDLLTPATIRKQERVIHPKETNGYEWGTSTHRFRSVRVRLPRSNWSGT
jgi:hypothetical protein